MRERLWCAGRRLFVLPGLSVGEGRAWAERLGAMTNASRDGGRGTDTASNRFEAGQSVIGRRGEARRSGPRRCGRGWRVVFCRRRDDEGVGQEGTGREKENIAEYYLDPKDPSQVIAHAGARARAPEGGGTGTGPQLETGEELGLVLTNQPPEGLGPEAGAALGRSATMPKTGHQGERRDSALFFFGRPWLVWGGVHSAIASTQSRTDDARRVGMK